MAGDWIKLEHATPDKPEVVQLAGILGFDDHDLAWAKCVRLWIWADQQSVDGNALTVTESFIDRFVRVTGFAAALRKVGWLDGRSGRLSIPDFARHNGKTAKTRASTQKRVKKSRSKRNEDVTAPPLPEKRREEKRNTLSHSQQFQRVWNRWKEHRIEKLHPLGEVEADAQLMALGRSGASEQEQIAMIEYSISRGAKNLITNGDHRRQDTGGRSHKSGSILDKLPT